MPRVTLSRLAVVGTVLIAAAVGYFFINQAARDKARAASAQSSAPGVPVTVGAAEKQDVPIFVRGLGTVQANKTVTVKTRVDGQITKVSFEEGQFVKEGDQLFQIDPRPFKASLDQATAAKERDQALLIGAELDLERYSKLVGTGFQSRQTFDQQKATVDSLRGSLNADQAAIDTAKLNLAYADIRSPIDGRTGQRLVDLGNLVQASQATSLVSITQIRPIFVNFTVPQDATDEIRRNQAAGALTVLAYAADDRTLLSEGKVTLIDNQIEAATGTLRMKATFENADERLWPGQFVNARLKLTVRDGVTTVPQRAVMQGASGYYAYAVQPDGTVQRRTLEIAATQDGIAVVTKGLSPGEKVVLEGQYRLSDGARVRIDTPPAASSAPAADKAG